MLFWRYIASRHFSHRYAQEGQCLFKFQSHLQQTSNVTSVTEVRSASTRLFARTWRPLVSVITTLLLCCDYFSLSSMASRAFSALCVYSKCGHHLLGYLCVKFHFSRGIHCWASQWRKIAHSVTQSITHHVYLMPREPKRLRFGTCDADQAQFESFAIRKTNPPNAQKSNSFSVYRVGAMKNKGRRKINRCIFPLQFLQSSLTDSLFLIIFAQPNDSIRGWLYFPKVGVWHLGEWVQLFAVLGDRSHRINLFFSWIYTW